ncbi:MAG: ComEC/Rec2 family competence protein [Clostridiales bacterium]|nr:ComEC/Rec2 family competence protein [Clostridiales bacterium]
MSSRLVKAVPGQTGKLLSAFLLGNRNLLPDIITRDFNRIGISHILSVSGMHFSILAGGLEFLLTLMRIQKKRRVILMILFTLFYMGLTGFALPVCRAGIMLLFVYAGFLFGQERDALTSLFIATAVNCLITPYAVLDAALWLSFLSTFGIIIANEVFSPIIQKLKEKNFIGKIIGTILFNLIITLAATFAILPLYLALFRQNFPDISLRQPYFNPFSRPVYVCGTLLSHLRANCIFK